MDLSTTYLGLKLPHPIMPGASPLADSLDTVKRLEDAGAAAIVMRSLFEEQIVREIEGVAHLEEHEESFAEAVSYFPKPDEFVFGTEEYLEQIRKIKQAVHVPVIAPNGTWLGPKVSFGPFRPATLSMTNFLVLKSCCPRAMARRADEGAAAHAS